MRDVCDVCDAVLLVVWGTEYASYKQLHHTWLHANNHTRK